MADIIKIIDSQQAFQDLGKLSLKLGEIQDLMNEMAKSASTMNASLNNITSVNKLNKEI